MAVPAHDERDWEFANKYNLPVTSVIAPLFGATTEEAIFRPDKITKERDVAYAIVRNPKDDTYLILNLLTGETGQSLIVGGVEQGEDWIQACKREIYEETGYKNLYLVDSLDTHVHAKFFALHKDENRYAKAKTFVFELIDEEQDAVNSVELERHDIMWLTKDQVDIKFHNQRYMWEQYVHGFSPNTDYGILVNS
jgi:ADP-ribose pyrophosphatase YjhB (NUDIX family)